MTSHEQLSSQAKRSEVRAYIAAVAIKDAVLVAGLSLLHQNLLPYYDQHGRNGSADAYFATILIIIGVVGRDVVDVLDTTLRNQNNAHTLASTAEEPHTQTERSNAIVLYDQDAE